MGSNILKTFKTPNIVSGTWGDCHITYFKDSKEHVLLVNNEQFMACIDDFKSAHLELYSQYDLAHGDVLLTGLGFGILPFMLLEKDNIKSITIIEKYQDVIDAFLDNNAIADNVTIIQGDADFFVSTKTYDCVLPDHWEHIRFFKGLFIKRINSFSQNIDSNMCWPWALEELFLKMYYSKSDLRNIDFILKNRESILKNWNIFIKKYFKDNLGISGVPDNKTIEYFEAWLEARYG
jgi:hypothetical protein